MLEDVIVPQQWLPTCYRKLSLVLLFVGKVIDPVPSSIDPALYLESEEHVVHPTLPLKSEVKVAYSMSSPPYPNISFESVNTEVVTLTKSLSHLPI